MADGTCVVDACTKPIGVKAPQLCYMHYRRQRQHGNLNAGRRPAKQTCDVSGCDRTGRMTRGWCSAHYSRWKRCGDVRVDEPLMDGTAGCSVDGCGRSHEARGYCDVHYWRARTKGDPGPAAIQTGSYDGTECIVDGCGRRPTAQDLCHGHYSRKRVMGDVFAHVPLERQPRNGTCAMPACLKPRHSRALCTAHYSCWWRSGQDARWLRPKPSAADVAAWQASQRLRQADYYRHNRERRYASTRAWRQRNPDRARLYAQANRIRRSKAPTVSFTSDQLAERFAYWGGRCWMCSGRADTVDHVKPINKGGWHALMNLRPACRPCNSRKRDRWPLPTLAAVWWPTARR